MRTEDHYQPAEFSACFEEHLTNGECRRLEDHLAECSICQSALEAEAAQQETWDDAREYLLDDQHDQIKFTDKHVSTERIEYQEFINALAPTDDPRMLGRLGPFEIAGIIGTGGMGVVLKAFDPALSRFVAMKVLAPRLWSDSQARERFAREARAAASIVHENVVEIYGVSEMNGIPYFTMPYLRGETLRQRLELCGPLPIEEVLRISKQLAEALAAAHAQGLVHRDIKPSNVLLTGGSDRVRLTDFGLAHLETDHRLTSTGVVTGTPKYMSPEQVQSQPLDARSDLFSLGTVIYEMCTGKPPFEAESLMQLFVEISEAKPVPLDATNPELPSWMAAIVAKLHAQTPDDRYDSAESLARDLEQCLANVQNPVKCAQPRSIIRLQNRYLRARRREKHGPLLAKISLVMGIVTAAALLIWFGGMLASPETGPVSVEGRVVDQDENPVAECVVLAVQKTWPNERYRQQPLKTKTDKNGRFKFEKFALPNEQYAFLLTALPEQHSMSSVYRLVKDGAQQDPVTLKVDQSQPITITVQDGNGDPLPGAIVFPSRRVTSSGDEYLTYDMQIDDGGLPTNENGVVKLSSFQPGDKAVISIRYQGQFAQREVIIDGRQQVSIRLPFKTETSQTHKADGHVVDEAGEPIADAKVLIIHKSWPNGRYRQQAYATTTNAQGEYQFPFTTYVDIQNALLVTILADGHEMKSEYQLFKAGQPIDPFQFKLASVSPVTLQFVDEAGSALSETRVSIRSRKTSQDESLIYAQSGASATWMTDDDGKITFGLFAPGDQVTFSITINDTQIPATVKIGQRKIQKVIVSSE